MQHKKGGGYYRIPYELGFTYTSPQLDSVPEQYQVVTFTDDKLNTESVATLAEALAVYMKVYREGFSPLGAQKRAWALKRFLRHLASQNHSMQLAALAYRDGKRFMDTLANANDGSALSLAKRKEYRSALRSFSRFLSDSGMIQEDVFFALRIE